jgi:O-antigen ligase
VLALLWSTLSIWAEARWPLSVAQAAILLAGVALAAHLAARAERLQVSAPLLLAAAGAAWLFLLCASGRTVYAFESWTALAEWLVVLALVFLGTHLFADEARRERLLEAYLWFAVAVAAVALVQFYAPNGKVFWLFAYRYLDVLGPFPNRNNFAAFLELAVPIAFWRGLTKPELRGLYLGAAAALVGAVVASGSRAGAAIVLAETLLLFSIAYSRGGLPRQTLARMAAWTLLAGGVAVAVAGWELLWRRLQAGDWMVYRRQIWASTLEMIAARPLTGFGPGTFQTVYPAFARFDVGLVVNHAHNDWLELAAEAGLPFGLLAAAMALWSVRPAIRSIWGLGVLAVFAHAFVDYPLARLGVAGWVWLFVGVLAAYSGKRCGPISP